MSESTAPAPDLATLVRESREAAARERDYGTEALILCDRVMRVYAVDGIEVQALQGLDLTVAGGEMVAVVGASGSGKSTLLNILAGIDAPTAGRARVEKWDLLSMSRADRVRYRRHTVGFVRQQTASNLVPYLTARQMVDLPMTAARVPAHTRKARSMELLGALGMGDLADRKPSQLSGGQQMRVAIAVALANEPHVCSPTSRPASSTRPPRPRCSGRCARSTRNLGVTIVIVTHDPEVSGQVERTVSIRDGRTSSEVLRRTHTREDGGAARHRRGVRGDGPRRPRPGAARLPRGAQPDPPGAARARGRPRHHAARLMTGPLLTVRGVHRSFGTGAAAVHALRDVSFEVEPGTMVALVGRSGSGKTTLLNIIGGLDRPDSGTVTVDGVDVTGLDEDGLSRLRREKVSYVFQTFGLIPVLSAAENVGVPLRLARTEQKERERRVELLLDLVGLAGHARQRPGELSGGQQQRVAIARALAASPRLLVADEPTGQLDAETGLAVMALLRGVVESEGVTALVSTHDPVMMELADRVIHIADGTLVEE
jgi:ABC-type lipoprotein export system ATPase subunit